MQHLLKHALVNVSTAHTNTHTRAREHTHTQTEGIVFASWEKTGLPFHFAKSNIQ